MSFISDIADYIEDQVAGLTVDTNVFIGADIFDCPRKSVVASELSGHVENESHLIQHPVQILSKDATYADARSLAYSINAIFANKPGFASIISNVFYCDILSGPACISRHADSGYVFSTNYLFRRR